jgi:hypothetical protein
MSCLPTLHIPVDILVHQRDLSSVQVSTNAGITIQDYISADSGFILVAPLPEGKSDIAGVDPSYMLDKVRFGVPQFPCKGDLGFRSIPWTTATCWTTDQIGSNMGGLIAGIVDVCRFSTSVGGTEPTEKSTP